MFLWYMDQKKINHQTQEEQWVWDICLLLVSLIIGLLSIFLIYKLHPFYNDFKVIESTEYHQGLKIEKSYKCQNNTEEVCSKIIEQND